MQDSGAHCTSGGSKVFARHLAWENSLDGSVLGCASPGEGPSFWWGGCLKGEIRAGWLDRSRDGAGVMQICF